MPSIYGVSFVDPAPDWYSASVPVIIYVISYNIGLRYNDNRLFTEYIAENIKIYFCILSFLKYDMVHGVELPHGIPGLVDPT